MTWQRFLARNHLAEGDYATTPRGWTPEVHTGETVDPHAALDILRAQRLRLLRYENQVKLLAGDLRRLEADALDEDAVCDQLAVRTGAARDLVATVLKEFFAL